MKKLFSSLTVFERVLWLGSLVLIAASFLLSPTRDILSLVASLIGATALIFVAKGQVAGQILTVVFAAFYGAISLGFRYYGEVITYLGMSAPMAIAAAVAWLKNPAKGGKEVAVGRMTAKKTALLLLATVIVTVGFYFILGALGNANLIVSTLSVTTSFLASALTFLRSPYYACAYAANDVVLIILWVAAAVQDISSLPMVACFVTFLANDIYGFLNWRRMEKRQQE
ncbi:MAG: nicotinamide mononucleotide transporter [Clostridia bacterium]|nr:nicotinamide mononucleotide transporter [Clostridia bacterium]